MRKAIVVKPETIEMLQAVLTKLPEIKTGYVRLLGPDPSHVYERELETVEEQDEFLIEFGLGRLWRVSPKDWITRMRNPQYAKDTLRQAETILRWAREYHRLAREAAAR